MYIELIVLRQDCLLVGIIDGVLLIAFSVKVRFLGLSVALPFDWSLFSFYWGGRGGARHCAQESHKKTR